MHNSSIINFRKKGLFVFFVLFSIFLSFRTISTANNHLSDLHIINHDHDSFRVFNHMIFDGVDFTVPNIVDEIDSNGIKYGGINF